LKTATYKGRGLEIVYRKDTIDRDVITEVIEWDSYGVGRMPPLAWPVVVDVGAHIGTFAALAALRGLGERILAYEVDGENCRLARQNTARFGQVEVIQAAVVGAERPAGYFRPETTNTGAYHLQPPPDQATPIDEYVTLADILAIDRVAGIGLLKMDCEGWEHFILEQAAQDGALERVGRISMEYHNFFQRKGSGLAAMLRNAGFEVRSKPYNELCGVMKAWRA
jgi:FkbM family methyltransferase